MVRRSIWRAAAVIAAAHGSAGALAQTPAAPVLLLPEMVVSAPPLDEAASGGEVSGEAMLARPAARPGEFLEIVPGLVVTQHSSEGKANQYYLRGFNLDHGTDLAISVDGMPVNMRTHGHGQGYADLAFLIPEFVSTLAFRKGPYFAEEGDFASAGAIRLDYLDRLERDVVLGTAGEYGYYRGLGGMSRPLGAGAVTVAAELARYDGPWDHGDDLGKANGFVRYAQGTRDDGFALTAMAYGSRWDSTDQVPKRAVESGLIGRFGAIDATDGGEAERYSLSGRWARTSASGITALEAYAVRSRLDLFSNFTFFLDDPVDGDQFHQADRRTMIGAHLRHVVPGTIAGQPLETSLGLQTRHDDIRVGLFKTAERRSLSTVRDDDVEETSVGLYAQGVISWTDWLRTTVGLRGDVFHGVVHSDTPQNSGDVDDAIVSPKFGLALGPFAGTEFFVNGGFGHHSNDIRGATISVDPADKTTPAETVPLLVRSKGAEIGVRSRAVDGLETALALFILTFDSEIVFVGDAGTTEASRPSRRIGLEWTSHYRARPWLGFDLDIAVTQARFTDGGPAGDRIPGAPRTVIAAGVELGERTGWFGAARLRYFGPRPLVEDGTVHSRATGLVSGRAGYRFENGLTIVLDGFNLLDSARSQIDYFYASRLPGEPAEGVSDIHFHPVEPRTFRLSVSRLF